MNNIIPIKVEKSSPQQFKMINWQLHNVCNYNCEFCSSSNKDGSNRWFTLEKYKTIVDKLATACEGYPFYILYTGGEPTLYPNLIELLQYSKSKGAVNVLISNGARTTRWWEELAMSNCLDRLTLTYHSDTTNDYRHISYILNLFHNLSVETACEITHTKNSINQAFEGYDYLIENTGAVIDVKAMFIYEYDIYSLYTEKQLELIKQATYKPGKKYNTKKECILQNGQPLHTTLNTDLNVIFNNGVTKNMDHQLLAKNQMNSFEGWECDTGKHFLCIEYDTLYRGVCRITGSVGSVDDEKYFFSTNNVRCDKKECLCYFDFLPTKINVNYLPK